MKIQNTDRGRLGARKLTLLLAPLATALALAPGASAGT
jgi:hypothetical protein